MAGGGIEWVLSPLLHSTSSSPLHSQTPRVVYEPIIPSVISRSPREMPEPTANQASQPPSVLVGTLSRGKHRPLPPRLQWCHTAFSCPPNPRAVPSPPPRRPTFLCIPLLFSLRDSTLITLLPFPKQPQQCTQVHCHPECRHCSSELQRALSDCTL